jgi:hypothetical protein
MPKELGPQINSGDIIPEVRELAVAWNGHRADDDFMNTVKLASDIQYVAIDLLKQFAEGFDLPEGCVERFFNDKKNGL